MKGRSLIRDYLTSLRHPEFWIYATWLGLVTKYRTSRLGMVWAFVPAIFYSFGVGWFFAHLQGSSAREFIPHLGLGYVIFRLVTVSLNECTTTYNSHSNFILDGRVRLTDYILRVVGRAMFYFVIALPTIAVALSLAPGFQPARVLWLVPSLLLVILNIGWMGAINSVRGARLREMDEVLGSVLMFSFLFTPILWKAYQIPVGTLRGTIARANPLFHMVEIVRAPLLGESLEDFSLAYLGVMSVLGWVIAAWVYRRYARFVPVWL